MSFLVVEKLNKTEISTLIELAWDFEMRRDFDNAIRNFSPVWSDIETNPDFSIYDAVCSSIISDSDNKPSDK